MAHDRQVRFILPLPTADDRSVTHTESGRARARSARGIAYDQAVRQRWRALFLVVKAKLEAVNSGIVTFEDEFAMFTVLPDGKTVREHVIPAIAEAYATGTVKELLS